jgi:hypothetical protein
VTDYNSTVTAEFNLRAENQYSDQSKVVISFLGIYLVQKRLTEYIRFLYDQFFTDDLTPLIESKVNAKTDQLLTDMKNDSYIQDIRNQLINHVANPSAHAITTGMIGAQPTGDYFTNAQWSSWLNAYNTWRNAVNAKIGL